MADYLTWLDWYASGAADTLAKSGLPGAKSKMADDEALWVMCMLSLSQIDDADAPARLNWSDSDLAQYVFFGAVAAIVPPQGETRKHWRQFFAENPTVEPTLLGGKGIKLSARLVQAFAYAKAPQTEDWKSLVTAHGWYLDLPHRSLMIGNRQIRAIFTHPDTLGGVAAVAILTEPGSDSMAGRYAWMLVGKTDYPAGCADVADIDALDVQRRANDFIALALLYYRSLEHCETLPRCQTGPHLSKIQKRLERKTKSLFVVHNLPDPVGNLGRPAEPMAETDGNGWRLDHRVTVRGHFRWQPVGEGRARRELRWIAEHHRGEDLPEKPKLIPLRKTQSRS